MILGYISLITVVCSLLLVATGVIRNRWYPVVIYICGALLVLQTSMLGTYLVGSDIQSEYWIAKHNLGGWDLDYPHLYNASISTGLLAPALSQFLHTDLIWVFKLVYPLLFATVPVLLYLAFRQMIDDKRALLTVFFFMIMPVYSLEMPQLPRQELAEVIFAFLILTMVSKWEQSAKIIILGFGCVIAMLCHWTIGILLVGYLLCILTVQLASRFINWEMLKNTKVTWFAVVVALCVLIGFGTFWGFNVAAALPIKAVTNIWQVAESTPEHVTETPKCTGANITGQLYVAKSDVHAEKQQTYMDRQEQAIQVAVGMDLGKTDVPGILFRAVQFITQFLIIVGCIYLLIRWRDYKFTTEFIACIGGSAVVLLLCIFVPNFSGLLGMTRFYHLTLFFLAPMLILGIDGIIYAVRRMLK